jgi:uncharacterized delta-60 repeat protein
MKKLILCFLLFIGFNSIAQDTLVDYLDNSFGGCGYIIRNEQVYDSPQKLALQPDGKIIMVGTSGIGSATDIGIIYRLMPDGSIDSSWGTNGRILVNYAPASNFTCSILIQNDNKVLIGSIPGNNNMPCRLQRFTENGIPDSSFANNSVLIIQTPLNCNRLGIVSLLQLSNNDILINCLLVASVSSQEQVFIKVKPDGSIDNTYGVNGLVRNGNTGYPYYPYNLILLNNDKVLVHGRNGAGAFVARYNSDGTLDTAFGQNGYFNLLTVGTAFEGMIGGMLPDSSIIMAGAIWGCDTSFVFSTHIDKSGNLISSYGSNGVAYLHASACTMSGGIVYPTGEVITLTQGISGYNGLSPITDIVLTKIAPTGLIDANFMVNGLYESDIFNGSEGPKDIIAQSDGKILIASTYEDYTTPDLYNIDYCIRRFWETADTLIIPADTTSNPPVDTTITNPTSIQNTASKYIYSVYPNPTTGKLTITVSENNTGALWCYIHTSQGQLVQQQQISTLINGMTQINLNSDLASGVYYLTLTSASNTGTTMFIKQ